MWDWNSPPIAIQRIEIPNQHFMRGQPTNCYVLGREDLVVVDPGDTPGADLVLEHLANRGNRPVEAIFLTHAHPDHAPAARVLRQTLGVPVMLHPDNDPIMREHISWSDIDIEINPDQPLHVDGLAFSLVMTPGHAPGHVALFHEPTRIMLAGDLVSGNGTIGVFPPHGSMSAYIQSLELARRMQPAFLLPGHGPVIDEPDELFDHYLKRRQDREVQIFDLVRSGNRTIDEFRAVLYPDLDPQLSYAADSTIRAHLIKLFEDGRVTPESDDVMTSDWDLAAEHHITD